MPVNQGAAASFLLPLRRFGGEGWGEGEGLAVANAYFVGSSRFTPHPALSPEAGDREKEADALQWFAA